MNTVAVYRVCLRLYPRRFRDEYAADMALLLSDQLQAEPALRVWGRLALDLLITIPNHHLEAHMNRHSTTLVSWVFALISGAAAIVAAILGSVIGWLGILLAISAASGITAVVAHRQSRLITGRPASANWWKFLAGGALTLAILAAVTTRTGELPTGWWVPSMIVLLAALGACVAGAVLGVTHLIKARSGHLMG
ncbi:MAG: hypothetical protein ACR2HR_03025 [Euzebya sp.]